MTVGVDQGLELLIHSKIIFLLFTRPTPIMEALISLLSLHRQFCRSLKNNWLIYDRMIVFIQRRLRVSLAQLLTMTIQKQRQGEGKNHQQLLPKRHSSWNKFLWINMRHHKLREKRVIIIFNGMGLSQSRIAKVKKIHFIVVNAILPLQRCHNISSTVYNTVNS